MGVGIYQHGPKIQGFRQARQAGMNLSPGAIGFVRTFSAMKILLLRFSSIGDIVLTTPVVRCLRMQLPDAQLHYLTQDAFAPLLQHNPHLNKVHTFNKRDGIAKVIPALKEEKFDFVVDLHHNLRSLLVKTKLGVTSASFPKLNMEKYLLVRLGINRLPDKHIVDRYFEAVKPLGVKNDHRGLDFFFSAAPESLLPELPEALHGGFVALVTGALQGTKQIPEHRLAEIIAGLQLPVALIGGKAESELGARLALKFPNKAFNYCGKLSLEGSAAMLQQSRLVMSADTGMMHIAAALKKPIASVWGNTVPEFGMYPYLPAEVPQYRAEVRGLKCRPCSKIGHSSCPKKHFRCMEDQDFPALIQWANGQSGRAAR